MGEKELAKRYQRSGTLPVHTRQGAIGFRKLPRRQRRGPAQTSLDDYISGEACNEGICCVTTGSFLTG